MWGDVDLVWSIIFVVIVLALVYWAVIVFTRTKIRPFEGLPAEPRDIEDSDDDEIDGGDLLDDEIDNPLAKDGLLEPFFGELIFIV